MVVACSAPPVSDVLAAAAGRDRSRRAWATTAALLVLIASLAWAPPIAGQTPGFEEPEIKAVFLFNFAQFVEWPQNAFVDQQLRVRHRYPRRRSVRSHHRRCGERRRRRRAHASSWSAFATVEDITTCHILFVGRVEADQFVHIFADPAGPSNPDRRGHARVLRRAAEPSGS